MPKPSRILLTGAAGNIGTMMRTRLPQYGHELRLFDRSPIPDEPDAVTAELHDDTALRAALKGVDAVVHLAGISLEAPFEEILRANIEGTHRLYEAARAENVRRIVLASSNHAVGFTPVPAPGGPLIPVETPHRPDTFYGLSKCFGEDLAALYWHRHGIESVCLRIGSCFDAPRNVRMLSTWLSPDDCARLLHASLTADGVGHTVVHGSSANTRLWWDLSGALALGYEPRDDSEPYAAALIAAEGEGPARGGAWLGGDFCTDSPPTLRR
ncbi:NAD-dependent epimerase/dehydratase family protein [Streptomyces sp. NPDC002537]